MQMDGGAGCPVHCAHADDVIDMRVSQPDRPERPAAPLQLGQKRFSALRRDRL